MLIRVRCSSGSYGIPLRDCHLGAVDRELGHEPRSEALASMLGSDAESEEFAVGRDGDPDDTGTDDRGRDSGVITERGQDEGVRVGDRCRWQGPRRESSAGTRSPASTVESTSRGP